jgi:hypothetical protein
MPNILQPSLSNTPTYKQTTETTGVAPYATDLLQRGQAFTTAETPVYTGQLTTGPSQYQNQSWQGLANLALPENSKFGTQQAQQYMNPYIQQALDPQLEYMRRQAAINQQGDMAKLAQVGAFGGSRQAILQGANQEALLRQQATTTGAGYEKAYNAAMAQFNSDQGNQRSNLSALSAAGSTQQEQEQAALDAQYKDWLRQTEYPGKQLETMKGLTTAMAGVMPKTETIYGQKKSALEETAGGVAGIAKLAEQLGVTPEQIKSVFGIKDIQGAINERKKKIADSNYGKAGSTNTKSKLGVPEGTHLNEKGELVDDETGEKVKQEGDEEGGDGGEGGDGEEGGGGEEGGDGETEEYDYDNDHAKGGLIDLLHKMRSYK